jgi:hypothetical protein
LLVLEWEQIQGWAFIAGLGSCGELSQSRTQLAFISEIA